MFKVIRKRIDLFSSLYGFIMALWTTIISEGVILLTSFLIQSRLVIKETFLVIRSIYTVLRPVTLYGGTIYKQTFSKNYLKTNLLAIFKVRTIPFDNMFLFTYISIASTCKWFTVSVILVNCYQPSILILIWFKHI